MFFIPYSNIEITNKTTGKTNFLLIQGDKQQQ